MRSETDFSTFVLTSIETLIPSEFEVAENQNILCDLTCVYSSGHFQLIHGFSETDIAIFKRVNFEKTSEKFLRFYGDKLIHEGEIAIPIVVLELKQGQVTTDAIRSRDFVAQRIRTIFPFCAYYFLAENTKKEEITLLRQGKSFSNYFIEKGSFPKASLEQIFNRFILPHLENFQDQFELH